MIDNVQWSSETVLECAPDNMVLGKSVSSASQGDSLSEQWLRRETSMESERHPCEVLVRVLVHILLSCSKYVWDEPRDNSLAVPLIFVIRQKRGWGPKCEDCTSKYPVRTKNGGDKVGRELSEPHRRHVGLPAFAAQKNCR